MKNEIVSKVNKIGKIGFIINNIAKIFITIGLVACIVGTALLAFVPANFVTFEISGNAVANIDFDNIPIVNVIDLGDLQNIDKADPDVDAEIDINGISYGVVDFERNDNGISVYAQADSYTVDIGNFKWFLIPVIIFLISALVVIHFIGKLCKNFQHCETPFTEEIVEALKKLAVAIIPMALLQSVTDSITNSMMTGDIDIVLGVDLMTVILVILIFLLATIFKYGTMLQNESDETL